MTSPIIPAAQDFESALRVLEQLTSTASQAQKSTPEPIEFSAKYRPLNTLNAALYVLHRAVIMGTEEQQLKLYEKRDQIVAFNKIIQEDHILDIAKKLNCAVDDLGSSMTSIRKMQVQVPLTRFEEMVIVITKIPRILLSVVLDILLLPAAGLLLLIAYAVKPDMNPSTPKPNIAPILLLHGKGFCEMEWVIGRLFLNKSEYGSVYSLNYDGLASNDPAKTLNNYIDEKILPQLIKMTDAVYGKDCKNKEAVVMGHSMGGLLAEKLRQKAKEHGITIKFVFTIATPWQEPHLLKYLSEATVQESAQYQAMLQKNLNPLIETALTAERRGECQYFSASSTTDPMVSAPNGILSEDPRHQFVTSFLGHYGIIVFFTVWWWVREHMDQIYGVASNPLPGRVALVAK